MSTWVEELSPAHPAEVQSQAVMAVRSLGTNAIPLFLRYLSYKDHDTSIIGFFKKHVAIGLTGRAPVDPVFLRCQAVSGFEVLGPLGFPAIPRLKKLINENETAHDAARSLGALKAPDALSYLSAKLDSPQPAKRAAAAAGLGWMKSAGRPAIARLAKLICEDESDSVRTEAAEALGMIGPAPTVAPILLDRLENDKNSKVRSCAAFALGKLPAQAEIIEQLRRIATQDKSREIRDAAMRTLRKLNGESIPELPKD